MSSGGFAPPEVNPNPQAEPGGIHRELTAYHASPYSFERFNPAEIGTGQGAASYGHGLYFAANPEVMEQYYEEFKRHPAISTERTYGGKPFNPLNPEHLAAQALNLSDNDRDAAIQHLRSLSGGSNPMARDAAKRLEQGVALPEISRKQLPHRYEVGLTADHDDFLDWDAPLKEQSPKVHAAINAIHKGAFDASRSERSGQAIYDSMSFNPHDIETEDQAGASKMLLDHGIKGIRYLDSHSRPYKDLYRVTARALNTNLGRDRISVTMPNTKDGAHAALQRVQRDQQELYPDARVEPMPTTHNYVVFDPNIIKVRRRYEDGGVVEHRPVGVFRRAGGRINREHDVPYLAGQSKDGKRTYVDRQVPKTLTVRGKQLDPDKYLEVHEKHEYDRMNKGEPYHTAHRHALKEERKAVEGDGHDWNAYQAQMHHLAHQTQAKKLTHPPPDLDTRPYPPKKAAQLTRPSHFKGGKVPATSKAQARLMNAVEHNPAFAKKAGIPQSVGKEFGVSGKAYQKLPARIGKASGGGIDIPHAALGGWIRNMVGGPETFPHSVSYDSAARGYRAEHPVLGPSTRVYDSPAEALQEAKSGTAILNAIRIARRANGGSVTGVDEFSGPGPLGGLAQSYFRNAILGGNQPAEPRADGGGLRVSRTFLGRGRGPGPAPTPYLGTTANAAQPYAPKIGHVGGLLSPVAGRTDHIPLDVPNGAYVLPADVISGLGQGNTIHGTKVADRMFHGAFHRPRLSRMIGGSGRRAGGVASGSPGDNVPIMAAGGEYVISPQTVAAVGKGDVKRGHEILDSFVKKVRGNTIKTLKNLPGPAKK